MNPTRGTNSGTVTLNVNTAGLSPDSYKGTINVKSNGGSKTGKISLNIPATPSIYSSGLLEIDQTWTADLDDGVVGAGSDSDIWFQAVTAIERYITPRNGATIAKVGTSPVGLEGCMVALLSTSNINDLPEGTFVCANINLGRYSQFQVNAPIGPSPSILSIDYTTWEAIY